MPALLLAILGTTACHLPDPSAKAAVDTAATYFSLRQFAADQVAMLQGQPYVLERKTVLNGQRDSGFAALTSGDWGPVLQAFLNADIGQSKYTGRYRFSSFPDEMTSTDQFVYEADDPHLFTRLLTIAADRETKRIVSIYAETAQGNFWGRREQKLYYAPRKVIQIQELATARVGPDKRALIEYHFPRERDDTSEL